MMKDKVIQGAFIVVIVAILLLMLVERQHCVNTGGTFVRTMFWFECLNK